MKSAKFEHRRTESLNEALSVLGSAEGETRVLGGGAIHRSNDEPTSCAA